MIVLHYTSVIIPVVVTTQTQIIYSTHKAYMDWNPEHFKIRQQLMDRMLLSVEQILTSMDYPEIAISV